MAFNAFRTSFRSAAANPLRRTAQVNRTVFRSNFRRYSTPPASEPTKSSSTGIYVGIGLAAAGGLAYYFYATTSGKEAATTAGSAIQAAKVKVNFVPSKGDYIKVSLLLQPPLLKQEYLCSCHRSIIVLPRFLKKLVNMMVCSLD